MKKIKIVASLRSGILRISNSKCVLFLNYVLLKGYLKNLMSTQCSGLVQVIAFIGEILGTVC